MRFRRSTVAGMAAAALLALGLLGPVAFAVLSMRSTPESGGAAAGAWIVIAIVLLLAAVLAAAAGGAAVALGRRMAERLGGRRPHS
jgi:membrane protein implicated in regulation of membrane protease activity